MELRSKKRTIPPLDKSTNPKRKRPSQPSDNLLPIHPSTKETFALYTQNLQTPFLRLPPEIKLLIYTLVLGHKYIQIHDYTGLLGYENVRTRRVWYHAYNLPTHTIQFGKTNYEPNPIPSQLLFRKRSECSYDPKPRVEKRLTRLDLVCRQMYDDCCVLMYSLHVFSFVGFSAMRRWLDARSTVQISAIRRVEVAMIHVAKGMVREMSGLERIWSHGRWLSVGEYLHGPEYVDDDGGGGGKAGERIVEFFGDGE